MQLRASFLHSTLSTGKAAAVETGAALMNEIRGLRYDASASFPGLQKPPS